MLFIYSCLDEDNPADNIASPVTIPPIDDRQNGRKAVRGVLVKTKDVGDRGKLEKEVGIVFIFADFFLQLLCIFSWYTFIFGSLLISVVILKLNYLFIYCLFKFNLLS